MAYKNIFFNPPVWADANFKTNSLGFLTSTCGDKKYLLKPSVIGHFLVIKAGEHYLIPCKKLALKTIMVKNGSENKITTKIFSIFQCIFSCLHVFLSFKDSFLLDT